MAFKRNLIYPALSYKISGLLFDVFKELGYGHLEKTYQNAVAVVFKEQNLRFKEQVFEEVEFHGEKIGKFFFDFLIEDKVVLELKQGNYFSKQNIEQIYNYLRVKNLKLGLLANFTRNGVKVKRILNIK